MKAAMRKESWRRMSTRKVWLNALLFAFVFGFLLFGRLCVNNPITGDEPHYLLMDYSLVHDHDLNLANNYANPKDYYSFYPAPLSPQDQVGITQMSPHATRQYSIHTIGLPLLVLPGFLIAHLWGVVIELLLITTVLVWLTWAWTKRLTGSGAAAYFAAASLTVCYSFTALAGYIYPEVCVATFLLASLLILDKYFDRPVWQMVFGLLTGYMVLLHYKTLPMVIPLLLVLTYKTWRQNRKLPWLAYLFTLPIILLFFIELHHWFGVWSPQGMLAKGYNFLSPPAPIVSALLFDSLRGSLIYNPLLLLLFVGLPIWFRRNRESFIVTLLSTIGYIFVLATFNGWQGGDTSIDRYIMDFLPAFIPALGFAYLALRAVWQKIAMALLFAATLYITFDGVLTKWPYVRFETVSPLFQQIQNHTGIAIYHLLPTFSNVTSVTGESVLLYKHGVIKIVAGYIVLLALLVYGLFLSKPASRLKNQPRTARPATTK